MIHKILLASILSLYAVEAQQLDLNTSNHSTMQDGQISKDRLNSNIVYARGNKEVYRPGEEIVIELKLHKNAFIYFWTLDENKSAQLILPNNFEAYNAYKKDIEYSVPEVSADYSFVSYKEGSKDIYVLSSPQKLSKKKIHMIIKEAENKKKNKKYNDEMLRKNNGIVVIAKKTSYDLVHFKVVVSQKKKNDGSVVKIAINPYGSSEGYYPDDKM